MAAWVLSSHGSSEVTAEVLLRGTFFAQLPACRNGSVLHCVSHYAELAHWPNRLVTHCCNARMSQRQTLLGSRAFAL